MNKSKIYPMTQAILSALLFGASAPLSKVLLGSIEPIPLASFLYIGSGIGLLILQLIKRFIRKQDVSEAQLSPKDIPWLMGSILFGGVAAPVILMTSLRVTAASTASLLLNFEGVATTMIAVLFFKENIGKRIWVAVLLITSASILLSWNFSNQWNLSFGALGIVLACLCWGIDNNFTRNISSKNPFTIVIVKGLGAGLFSLFLALSLKIHIPSLKIILAAMLLGFISYGFSIVLFVLAMRNLGSTRASTLFGTAPFIGATMSFILLRDVPNSMFFMSVPTMIIGTILLLQEKHNHLHIHEYTQHEHRHNHTDCHHIHENADVQILINKYHSHSHTHEKIEHIHEHSPDTHHRHSH